jgi:NitT/TauT family transport system ATP-binding protein
MGERTAAALAFEDVSLTFPNGHKALRGLSLRLAPGEFVGLVGPSGCGKTSLLRVAAGLTDYSAGKVFVDRNQLGYTFQDATLLPWRTVRGNVELLMELRGYDIARRRAIAATQIERVGLAGFEDAFPAHLSGGMKMRVSLARSLALDPKVFLFDEPFAALDELTRERLNDDLIAQYRRQNFTALFVTHDIAEAVYLSTRVLVMSARPGRIAAAFDVPFGYPRAAELRYQADFARLCGDISAALRATQHSDAGQ